MRLHNYPFFDLNGLRQFAGLFLLLIVFLLQSLSLLFNKVIQNLINNIWGGLQTVEDGVASPELIGKPVLSKNEVERGVEVLLPGLGLRLVLVDVEVDNGWTVVDNALIEIVQKLQPSLDLIVLGVIVQAPEKDCLLNELFIVRVNKPCNLI